MDKQHEQTNQNPNQEVEYISGFLNEDEEVTESEFDESTDEHETGKLSDNQQNEQQEEEQPKKTKRPRKTIEQEIAELDEKRERLIEKKRRQEAHEKIVFGSTMIAILLELKNSNNNDFNLLYNCIITFINKKNIKYKDIVYKILSQIK